MEDPHPTGRSPDPKSLSLCSFSCLIRTWWEPDRVLRSPLKGLCVRLPSVALHTQKTRFCAPCTRQPPNGPSKNLLKNHVGFLETRSSVCVSRAPCPNCPSKEDSLSSLHIFTWQSRANVSLIRSIHGIHSLHSREYIPLRLRWLPGSLS